MGFALIFTALRIMLDAINQSYKRINRHSGT